MPHTRSHVKGSEINIGAWNQLVHQHHGRCQVWVLWMRWAKEDKETWCKGTLIGHR